MKKLELHTCFINSYLFIDNYDAFFLHLCARNTWCLIKVLYILCVSTITSLVTNLWGCNFSKWLVWHELRRTGDRFAATENWKKLPFAHKLLINLLTQYQVRKLYYSNTNAIKNFRANPKCFPNFLVWLILWINEY